MRISEVTSHRMGDAVLTAVHTDTGLVGVGESACWAFPEAVEAMIGKFGRYLIGQDPARIEYHWHMMWRMGPFRGAVIGAAVSAVDVALWDLRGQHLGVPTYALLGGPYRDRIRLHKAIGGEDADALGHAAKEAADAGFTAVKYDPLAKTAFDHTLVQMADQAIDRATAIRDATNGTVDTIVELHRSGTPHQIPAIVQALAPFRPIYIEDPIQIDTIDVQTDLTKLGPPLGLGERWQSLWEIREALSANGPFVVRSDVNMAGGITAARKIAAVAEASHAQVSWHNWLGPVSDAATLTVDASIPNVLTHEHVPSSLTMFGDAIETDWSVDSGHMVVPSTPGLGVRVDFTKLPGRIDYLGRELQQIPRRSDGSLAFAL